MHLKDFQMLTPPRSRFASLAALDPPPSKSGLPGFPIVPRCRLCRHFGGWSARVVTTPARGDRAWVECLLRETKLDTGCLSGYVGIPRPRKGAQGLASQVWVTTERRTRGDAWRCLDGLCWWPARDTPARVGRWLQRPFADGRGAAKALYGSTRPSVGRSGMSTPSTVAGGNAQSRERTGHKTPCAGGLGAWPGGS